MWKPKSGEQGISYIFSVMLMTLVISSLAATVLLWGMGVVTQNQSAYSAVFQQKIERVKERLVVEDVRFKLESPQRIYIYIRNVGLVPLTVDRVYVNHKLATIEHVYYDDTPEEPPAKLGIGDGALLEVIPPTPLAEEQSYLITVATTRGKTVTDYWVS